MQHQIYNVLAVFTRLSLGRQSAEKEDFFMNKHATKTPAMALVLSFIFAFAGCGIAPVYETPQLPPVFDSPIPSAEGAETSAEDKFLQNKTIAEDGVLKDFTVSFAGAEKTLDSNHQAAIVFYFDFTNNSPASTSAFLSLSGLAYQDGRQLREAEPLNDPPYWFNDSYEIRPGATIRCSQVFSFVPAGGSVSLQLWQWSGGSSQIVQVSYAPSMLPGQDGSFEIPPAGSPYLSTPLSDSGDFGQLHVTLGNSELITDSDSRNCIRIFADFTNRSAQAVSFSSSLDFIAFQDNIELQYGSPAQPIAQDSGAWLPVQPGETVSLALTFLLRTKSPVVFEVSDFEDSLTIGKVYQ